MWINGKRNYFFGMEVFRSSLGFMLRNWRISLLSAGMILIILWCGNVLRMRASHEMCSDISITIFGRTNDQVIAKPFVKLARSGNALAMDYVEGNRTSWMITKACVGEVYIALNSQNLDKLGRVELKIGFKSFDFSHEEFLNTWQLVKLDSSIGNFLTEEPSGLILQAPNEMRAMESQIPIARGFFDKLINWAGDDKVIIVPFLDALYSFLIILLSIPELT